MTIEAHAPLTFARLIAPFRTRMALAALAGLVGGAAMAGVLAAVNAALADPTSFANLALVLGLGGAALAGTLAADLTSTLVGQKLVAELRTHLARLILGAPLRELEQFRGHRLIPILVSDIAIMSEMASVLPPLAVALVVVAGCLAYLALLSPLLFGLTFLVLVIGVVLQLWARVRGVRLYVAARDAEDDLHRHFRTLVEGAKELQLHRGRRQRLLSDGFVATAEHIRALQARAMVILIACRTLGSGLLILLVALVVGLAAHAGGDPGGAETARGFVLVLLFMKGPLDQLLNHLPAAGRAHIAWSRIRGVARRFGALQGPKETARRTTLEPLRELRLEGVAFQHADAGGGFQLGPLDLSIRAGETVFVAGANGAGKTTLIKLLLGLYVPGAGHVLWNGQPVREGNRDDYRQMFAAVLSDHFLFDGPAEGGAGRALGLLDRLGLAHKVTLEGTQWSTLDLSTGQRKRLALVDAWLQDRPVMVFDEWAADQDPAFRRLFYEEILPELKLAGRTLIVISHDDRYFAAADRLLMLEGGQLQPLPAPRPVKEAAP
ncbi:cyclic peptide export ABC transporter [Aquabacter sp. L1I39]|uniref:cyclic peptide export ABC transporter n=1 Tax=Aquabacter sp. L1I39 TaxID=2820278 RepID=UPI001ADC40E7|nr:cyclic peptide export ABC transporter [Aquabacter sp. L1I39]QTL04747.1 cyclic peptide export ABC transporter [Aquabacter sp. L1I39]